MSAQRVDVHAGELRQLRAKIAVLERQVVTLEDLLDGCVEHFGHEAVAQVLTARLRRPPRARAAARRPPGGLAMTTIPCPACGADDIPARPRRARRCATCRRLVLVVRWTPRTVRAFVVRRRCRWIDPHHPHTCASSAPGRALPWETPR